MFGFYSLVNVLAASFCVFGLLWSARLIKRYSKKYEQVELFWVAWILVMVLVVGNKFI